jgi:hypothetical protein
MSNILKDDTWVWVVIQDPGKNEVILGQMDDKKNISFIPTFQTKDEALMCLNLLSREPGATHEVQAILYEDLVQHASENKFAVIVLNGVGEVIEEIDTRD